MLTLFSDLTCPYCYLVEAAVLPRLISETKRRIEWRPFEVDPSWPDEGLPPVLDWYERFTVTAHHFGLTRYRVPRHVPNARRVLAMAEFARDEGRLAVFRRHALRQYWEEQGDLDGPAALRALARRSGLDVARALRATTTSRFLARIDAARDDARRRGISAVPTLDVAGHLVVGAQPWPVFLSALGGLG